MSRIAGKSIRVNWTSVYYLSLVLSQNKPTFRRLSTSDDSKFGLNVQVALDNLVIIDQVKVERPWRPLLLFIPLRLGLCDINPLYFNDLKVNTCLICGSFYLATAPSRDLLPIL